MPAIAEGRTDAIRFEICLAFVVSRVPSADSRCYDFCFPTSPGRHLYMFRLIRGGIAENAGNYGKEAAGTVQKAARTTATGAAPRGVAHAGRRTDRRCR